ncbi:MAG: NAD+ synthetase, partial [Planctomycetaceae bacterium]|nr:NAD+ synthetase [Planctomycetaceae bacterium]
MRFIRVATAALNQTPLDWEGNVANIRQAIETARARDANLLCLPELCITGYGCEDAFFSADVLRRAERALEELVPLSHGILVSIGLPILHAGGLFNATAVLIDRQLVGVVAKQHLAGDGLHYEPRWFKPWPANVVSHITLAGRECPIGDLLFDLNGIRVGFEICEDAWVANRPGVDHANLAADIIMNPSASHFAFGKAETRRRLVEEASRSLGVAYVYSNLLGNEAGRIIYDGQTLVAANGELVACGPRLGYGSVCVTDAVVDVDSTRLRRAQLVSFQPQVAIETDRIVSVDFSPASVTPAPPRGSIDSWETSGHLKEEEFTRAITLALFDYLRKSRSRGFVVSLSGGADSSAVACLVAIMIRLAVAELGYDGFCQRIDIRSEGTSGDDEIASLTSALLTTVYQSTRNSSEATRESARVVANALGADHIELDVDELCEGYTRKIETALDRSLDWERDDVVLQNIQARVRGPAVWMLSNVRNALLLATSNRSEAAVGYATMDGDT